MARPLIAIVDDAAAHLRLLAEILEQEGYRVATLADLHQGYVFVKAQQPALVLLDLLQGRQPVGLEVLRRLRADPATRHLPIVVMSAAAELLRAHAEAFRAEGIGVLEMPYELDDLLMLVSSRLPARAMSAPRPTLGSASGVGPPQGTPPSAAARRPTRGPSARPCPFRRAHRAGGTAVVAAGPRPASRHAVSSAAAGAARLPGSGSGHSSAGPPRAVSLPPGRPTAG